MTATAPSPSSATSSDQHKGVFPGWYVVGAVFVMMGVSAGLGFYGLSVYLEAITDEKGFSTATVSLATSLFFVVAGLAGRVIGQMIAVRDVRQVVIVGALIAAVALSALGQIDQLWQLYVVYAVFAVGFACTAIVPGTTVVTRWFHRRRSVAVSVASTGLSVGGLTLTKLASALIDSEGLAASTPWLGVAYAVIVIPVAALLMWPDPASRGTTPDGEPRPAAGAPLVVNGVAYDVAIHSRFFLCMTAGFVFLMGAQVGGIAQLAKLVTERVDRSTGALAVSTVALASVVARLIGGVVAGRAPMTGLTTVLAGVQGVAMLLLAVAENTAGLLLASALFGATVGNLLMLQPLILAETFGVLDYPRIFSLNQLVVTLGIAGGPFLLGLLHDISGYRLAYAVAACASVLGAVLVASGGSVRSVQSRLWPSLASA